MKTIGRSINWRISAENIQFSLLQLSSPTTRYFTWKSCYSKEKITQPSLKIALFSSPSIVLTYEDTLSIFFFSWLMLWSITLWYHCIMSLLMLFVWCFLFHICTRGWKSINSIYSVLRFCLHFISLLFMYIFQINFDTF